MNLPNSRENCLRISLGGCPDDDSVDNSPDRPGDAGVDFAEDQLSN